MLKDETIFFTFLLSKKSTKSVFLLSSHRLFITTVHVKLKRYKLATNIYFFFKGTMVSSKHCICLELVPVADSYIFGATMSLYSSKTIYVRTTQNNY